MDDELEWTKTKRYIGLGVYKMYPDAFLPEQKTNQAACWDVRAYLKQDIPVTAYSEYNQEYFAPVLAVESDHVRVPPHNRVMIPTGIILSIPEGYHVRVYPRSGLALKLGLGLVNSVGIVDSDFYHELKLLVTNLSQQVEIIHHGDRIAQIELVKSENVMITEVAMRPAARTNRVGGFGSTGVK